jgi:hypothetical protein
VSNDVESLYRLLPAVYRIRDAAEGEPLKALLSVIAAQLDVLEEDLAQLYDDQFVETCAGWAVPYLGDAIGYRPLDGKVPSVRTPRAEVADTIALRRHKGTAAMLEVLAREVTGWDARVVEFFQLLATTQYMNHIRLGNTRPDLRQWEPLERLGTAFEALPHNADVRGSPRAAAASTSPTSASSSGASAPTPPRPRSRSTLRFLFSPWELGAALHPAGGAGPSTSSRQVDRLNVPADRPPHRILPGRLLRAGQSFFVWADGVAWRPVRICNLTTSSTPAGGTGDWTTFRAREAAIDPCWPHRLPTRPGRRSVYHRGWSADMGGGEYDREAAVGAGSPRDARHVPAGVTQDRR